MNQPNWVNRTMWTGDNLDIMRGMNSESVDLIYLDPPFNSNRNFAAPIGSEAAGVAFKDTWTLDDVDMAWHGEIAEQHPALYAIIGAARESYGPSMQSYLIMMGVRILEMHRLLRQNGSIYLHCDRTASHYLKLLMDSVFGPSNFQNEVVWRRTTAHNDSKRYGSNVDKILFYTKSNKWTWNVQYQPYTEEYKKRFNRKDPDGRVWSDEKLVAKGLSGGGYEYEYKGTFSLWAVPLKTMKRLDAENRLHFTSKGGIRYKKYLDEMKGRPAQSLWDDINALNSQAKERTGYPTQKPLALLDRIIKASSNEGDMVFDPFCGCATACVAADRLERQWVGIDLSPLAAKLVRKRIQAEGPLLYDLTHRADLPRRTDVGQVPHYRTQKHTLFGLQEGTCNGCRVAFPFRNFTVDHIIPRSRGGTDHPENLQLLCAACNSLKGNRSQPELIAELRRQGIIE